MHGDAIEVRLRCRAVGQHLIAGTRMATRAQQQRATEAALGRRVQGAAIHHQWRVVIFNAVQRRGDQLHPHALGVAFQRGARHAVARGLRHGKGGIARFIVLRVGTQHVGRRQDGLARHGVADGRAGDARLRRRRIRTIAHGHRAARLDGAGQAIQFHAEGARQQGEIRWQQGVGTGRQAGHARGDGDLASHGRLARALLGRQRRHVRLHAGNDGVHGVGIQAGQGKAAIRLHLHQRIEARIGGAAPSGQEGRARQGAAARQVEHGAGLHVDGGADQGDLGAVAHALEDDVVAVIQVAEAIERAAVRHRQAFCADGRQAARQQIDMARIGFKAFGPQCDLAQRRAQHAVLVDRGRDQAQAAEHGKRLVRRGAAGAALDSERAQRIERDADIAVFIDPAALPHRDHAAIARGRIDLRGDQGGVAGLVQGGVVRHAQVAAAIQGQLLEGIAFDGQRRAAALHDLAARTHVDLASEVEHARIDLQQRAVGHQRHAQHAAPLARVFRAFHGIGHDVIVFLRARGRSQAHIRRRQAHLAGKASQLVLAVRIGLWRLRRLLRQAQRTGAQAQALAQRQADVAIDAEHAVHMHGQVIEAACLHAVDAQARTAVAQGFILLAGAQINRQYAVALHLRQHEFARYAHRIVDAIAFQRLAVHLAIIGRVERHRQGAAGRPGATGHRAQRAIGKDAVVRTERNQTAAAGHVDGALVRQVQRGLRAAGVEQRARAHDDKGIGRVDAGRVGLVAGADFDAAALVGAAITAAAHVGGDGGAAGDVEHRVFADPDRRGLSLAVRHIGIAARAQRAGQDGDLAAPGIEAAVDADLAIARHADLAARIDRDDGALRHRQGTLHVRAAGRQRQVGAGALRQAPLARIFLVQLWRPHFQRGSRIRAARHRVAGSGIEAQHGHFHIDPRILDHHDAVAAGDGVVGKAALEQAGVQRQHGLHGNVTAQHGAGRQQRAARRAHVVGGDAAGRILRRHRQDGQAVRESRRRDLEARSKAVDGRHHAAGGRDGAAPDICRAVDDDVRARWHQQITPQHQRFLRRHVDRHGLVQDLARLDQAAGKRKIEGNLLALGNQKFIGQAQADGGAASSWQHVAVLQLAADADGRAAVDRQASAALHAMAAQLAVKLEQGARRRFFARQVDGQGDVAAAPALQAAIAHQGSARRNVNDAAAGQFDAARTLQCDLAAIHVRQAGDRARVQFQIAPQPPRIETHARRHAHAGRARGSSFRRHGPFHPHGARVRQVTRDDVTGGDAAAARAHVRLDGHVGGVQGNVAAIGHAHVRVDVELVVGVDIQDAQFQAIEPVRIELQGLAARGRQGLVQQLAIGDGCHLADLDVFQHGLRAVAQLARLRIEDGRHFADDQLTGARGRRLRLLVAIDAVVALALLAFALKYGGVDIAFQHGGARGNDQAARIAAHRVAVFQALAGTDQGIRMGFRRVRAPARMRAFITAVQARVQIVARGSAQLVHRAIGALQPRLLDHARLHVQRTAGDIDARTGLRHHFAAAKADGATLGRPFADAVAAGIEVAAHFQQAARRVPAVRGVAVGAGRHQHQVAAVDPHVAVVQVFGVAAAGRVALFVALHIDQHIVAAHVDLHADGAGHVDGGAARHVAAAGRIGQYLAARGQSQRIAFELDVAGGNNAHQRLVAPVLRRVRALARVFQQGVALHVERRGAIVVDDDGADAAARQGHAGVLARRRQVDRAAAIDGRARQQHAILAHAIAAERDVARGRLDQAVVDDAAGAAVGHAQHLDFIAARARILVLVRAHALAHDDGVAGRQDGLAIRRGDGARILDGAASQQHVAAAFRHRLRLARVDARAGGDDDVRFGRRMRKGILVQQQIIREGRHGARALRLAVQAAFELAVAHAHGGRCQVARIDLAAARKHDTVAVDDHHRAVGLDLALDLAGARQRIVDAVQHGPVRFLVELQGGVLADVKTFPVQDCLVVRLHDLHDGLAIGLGLHGRLGVEPARRQAVAVDLQAALDEAIGRAAGRQRRLARGRLYRLFGGDAARGQQKIVQRLLQLAFGLLLLQQRVVQRCGRLAIRQASRGGGRALLRALAREPGAAERLLRLRAARLQQHGDGQCQRFQAHRAPVVAARHGGGGCVFRDRLASLHGDIPFSCSVADRYREAARGTHGGGRQALIRGFQQH
ncbi:hypothetical protein D3C85_311190 [compost metagenome]